MPQISIIVPVYGAEKYLHRCLDSIIAQTFTNWECILVDDGSIDRSGVICDEYAQADRRFCVFHKENGGVSSARQFGMKRMLETDSKYAIFADPDDWLDQKMLELLYKKGEETEADMVICDFWDEFKNKTEIRKQDPKSNDPQNVMGKIFQGELFGCLWNKMIKSSCFSDYKISFPKGLNWSEDFYVITCLLQKIGKVAYLPLAFYHYDQYSNNQSETRNEDKQHILKTHTDLIKRIRNVVDENMKDWRYYMFEVRLAYNLLRRDCMSDNEFREFFSSLSLITLIHPHKNYIKSLCVYLVLYLHFKQATICHLLERRVLLGRKY